MQAQPRRTPYEAISLHVSVLTLIGIQAIGSLHASHTGRKLLHRELPTDGKSLIDFLEPLMPRTAS